MPPETILQQVRAALGEQPPERQQAVARLRDQAPLETLDAILTHLDSDNPDLIGRAAGCLTVVRDLVARRAEIVVRHLCEQGNPRVRLSCAIALMSVEGECVTQAYLRALADPFEKVAQIACLEVGHRRGPGSAEALFEVLSASSWRVRLEACKALIVQRAADGRVVATLDAMGREPEAAVYDAEDDQFDEFFAQAGPALGIDLVEGIGERWGKLATILAKAREIAEADLGPTPGQSP